MFRVVVCVCKWVCISCVSNSCQNTTNFPPFSIKRNDDCRDGYVMMITTTMTDCYNNNGTSSCYKEMVCFSTSVFVRGNDVDLRGLNFSYNRKTTCGAVKQWEAERSKTFDTQLTMKNVVFSHQFVAIFFGLPPLHLFCTLILLYVLSVLGWLGCESEWWEYSFLKWVKKVIIRINALFAHRMFITTWLT